jgi:hypothetical protein
LQVDPNLRISTSELTKDPWILSDGCGPIELLESRIGHDMLQDVADKLRSKLHLKIPIEQVLDHVAKQPYRTTGGCFNLLILQQQTQGAFKSVSSTPAQVGTLQEHFTTVTERSKPPIRGPALAQIQTSSGLENKQARKIDGLSQKGSAPFAKQCGAKQRLFLEKENIVGVNGITPNSVKRVILRRFSAPKQNLENQIKHLLR